MQKQIAVSLLQKHIAKLLDILIQEATKRHPAVLLLTKGCENELLDVPLGDSLITNIRWIST